MPDAGEPSTYTTYILRCWQEGSAWRYSLEEMGSGRRHGFAGLDDFVSFMLARSAPPASKIGGSPLSGQETARTDKS